jgi:hypothetical protein
MKPADANPYASPVSPGLADRTPSDHPAWRIIPAIPLFIYSIAVVLYGGVGLLFLPGILMGGISIGRETTLLKVISWSFFHATAIAHGCAVFVAALSLCKSRWRRAMGAFGVAGILLVGLTTMILLMSYFG